MVGELQRCAYVACLETLFMTKSLKTRQAKFSTSCSLCYIHTHSKTFHIQPNNDLYLIYTLLFTLIEYLAESAGGDGVHWAKESSVLVTGPIR